MTANVNDNWKSDWPEGIQDNGRYIIILVTDERKAEGVITCHDEKADLWSVTLEQGSVLNLSDIPNWRFK